MIQPQELSGTPEARREAVKRQAKRSMRFLPYALVAAMLTGLAVVYLPSPWKQIVGGICGLAYIFIVSVLSSERVWKFYTQPK